MNVWVLSWGQVNFGFTLSFSQISTQGKIMLLIFCQILSCCYILYSLCKYKWTLLLLRQDHTCPIPVYRNYYSQVSLMQHLSKYSFNLNSLILYKCSVCMKYIMKYGLFNIWATVLLHVKYKRSKNFGFFILLYLVWKM